MKSEMTKLLLRCHNRRQNLFLLLRPKIQTAIPLVEKPVLSTSKENVANQVKHQDFVGDIQR
jgi:hypothetical protein